MRNRDIKVSYNSDGATEYWGQETATGEYLIKRYYYDSSGGLINIKEDRLGHWDARESLDWS